jgi:TonB-dependent receptor
MLRHPSHRWSGLWLLALLLVLSHVLRLGAQPAATGSVAGRVFEQATGKSLQGAIVRVAGSNLTDSTDADGRYHISTVPAGPRLIEVDYVGLDAFRQAVTVAADHVATLDAPLRSEALLLQPFEVAEAARGQALAINQQKTARGIVNIVSEETFGAMNEGNIGYVLQRLPGLTVNEDEDGTPEGVNIRGLPAEFNAFQVDGNRVARGGFNARALAADGVANIEVIKAATPDKDGDAIGGTINVVSRSAFQRDGREIRLGLSGTYLGLPGKWGYNARATYTDLLGILGGSRNLGVSVTATHYLSNRYYTNNDSDFGIATRASNPTYDFPTEVLFFITNASTEYNLRATRSTGLNATLDFRAGPGHTFYLKPLFSRYTLSAQRYITRPFIDNARFQDTVNGRKTYEILQYNHARGSAGANGSRGEIRYSADLSETDNNLWSLGGGGRHEIGPLAVNYDAFCSRTVTRRTDNLNFIVRNVPVAQGYFQWEYDLSDRLYPRLRVVNGLDPRNPATMNRADLTMEPERRVEEAVSAKLDAERKFAGDGLVFALKAGGKVRATFPRFDQTQGNYTTGTMFPYAQVVRPTDRVVHHRPQYLEVIPAKVRELLAASPALFVPNVYAAQRASIIEDFAAEEQTGAAYVMGTAQVGRHTTILGGVRVEANWWSSRRKQIDQATLRETPVGNGSYYTNVLPGLHFRHVLAPNLILRESINRSYGRPTLARLTLGRSEDINGNITQGNPYLRPTTSDNLDVQLEQYTARGGLLSVGFFWKRMRGFYYNQSYKFSALDANGDAIPNPNGARTWQKWQNAAGAENKGLELIAQQKLQFLPKPFNGLGLSLSATFTDSVAHYPDRPGERLPTYGFSRAMFNVAGDYVLGPFRGRLSYRYRSAYLEGIDTSRYLDDWYAAREQVDAEVSWRFRRTTRLTVSGENLTSRPQASYQGYLPYIEDNSNYGWRVTAAVELTF